MLVAPLQQLQVVLGRVLAVPVDPVVVGDAGLAVRRPQLHGPEQRAEVLVEPVLGAGDDLLRVVLEIVEDADRRIAGELGAEFAETLVDPQVFGRHVGVGLRAHRPQDDAAVGVEADRRTDVRVLGDEVHHRAHLGLAGRVRAGAGLFELLAPVGREVAVQVEPFEVRVGADLQAVVVAQQALGHDAEILAADVAGLARHHQPRVFGVLLPAAVCIGHAHAEHAAVAVDVFDVQAIDRRFVERVRACRRADVARLVGQRQFGAVGVQPRADVDRARVQQVRDAPAFVVIDAEVQHQVVQPVQAGGAGGELGGVDVAVDPEGRLVAVRAGVGCWSAPSARCRGLRGSCRASAG